jgi:hypothetical protein
MVMLGMMLTHANQFLFINKKYIMKFSQYLEKITGVGVYPMVSLLLFVFFFTVVTIIVFKQNKAEIDHIENLPLDN